MLLVYVFQVLSCIIQHEMHVCHGLDQVSLWWIMPGGDTKSPPEITAGGERGSVSMPDVRGRYFESLRSSRSDDIQEYDTQVRPHLFRVDWV